MTLLGLDAADIAIYGCAACLHAFRSPKFDTSILYSEQAYRARKQAFEADFPGRSYGATGNTPSWAAAMGGAAREFRRFSDNARAMAGLAGAVAPAADGTIRILDWGGGSGAVGALYAQALRLATGRDAAAFVYDPSYDEDAKRSRLNRADVTRYGPYQVALLSHVLEHSHDPIALLRDATSHLETGAVVIVEVPDERMNYVRCGVGRRFALHYHVAWFSRRSLHRTLTRAGLRNVGAAYHYRAAYHGAPATAILAWGVATSGATGTPEPAPGRGGELLSLVFFALRRITGRIIGGRPLPEPLP